MTLVGCYIHPVITSLLAVGEDKGDLLHKGTQPYTETIPSTQLGQTMLSAQVCPIEQ